MLREEEKMDSQNFLKTREAKKSGRQKKKKREKKKKKGE